MNQIDVAWLAGYLEGEACFQFGKTNRSKIRNGKKQNFIDTNIYIRVGCTDLDILEKAQSIAECGHIRPKKNLSEWSKLPQYEWVISKRSDIHKILDLIIPYMGIRRTQKIETMLEYLNRAD